MLFWIILRVGLKSLLANKLRSLLAMLGIIIGVAAVVTSVAIGTGAKKQVLSRMTAMGTNLLYVRPGQSGSHGVASGTRQTLKEEDATAIIAEVKSVQRIAPVVGGSVQAKYMSRNSRTNITGTSVTWLEVRNFTVEKGRGFTEGEVDNNAHVAVIGPMTAQTLFDADDPLGLTLKLNSLSFTVIGVLKSKGDQNMDDQILVPYTTAMKQLFGVDYLREINVQVEEGGDMTATQNAISAVLRKRHRLQDSAPDDFSVRNQADMIEALTENNKTFTMLLTSIAVISLLVGGIGIMNIMLVSVTERTREIGIRKAIGARRANILTQFLIESATISGLGGLMGVGVGVGAARVVANFSQFITEIDWSITIIALVFSGAVGVIFGLYPAWRAARLDPVVALRYE